MNAKENYYYDNDKNIKLKMRRSGKKMKTKNDNINKCS